MFVEIIDKKIVDGGKCNSVEIHPLKDYFSLYSGICKGFS